MTDDHGLASWLTARPIAHRGLHDLAARRVENTPSAFEAAIHRGYAIECDLQLAGDGTVMVFHDDRLERLTEASGPLAAHDVGQLKQLRFCQSDDHMPTLEELLRQTDGRVPLLLELKSRWNGDDALARAVAALVQHYHGPCVAMSFDPGLVAALRHLAPALPRGLVADRFHGRDWPQLGAVKRFALRHMLGALRARPQFIAYDARALPAIEPLLLKRLFGLPLLSWTVRNDEDARRLRRYADQIIFEGFDPDALERTLQRPTLCS